jgi:hypothetical protein
MTDLNGKQNLNDKQKMQLNYLLADFVSVKGEISRRSTLQWFILAGYFSALALVFQQIAASKLSGLWVTATWAVSALAYQFYAREYLEIARLSRLIGDHIAPVVSNILSVPREEVLPSESGIHDTKCQRRQGYATTFNRAAFFGVPLLITLLLAHLWCNQHGCSLGGVTSLVDVSSITQAVISLACAVRVCVLLGRHPI